MGPRTLDPTLPKPREVSSILSAHVMVLIAAVFSVSFQLVTGGMADPWCAQPGPGHNRPLLCPGPGCMPRPSGFCISTHYQLYFTNRRHVTTTSPRRANTRLTPHQRVMRSFVYLLSSLPRSDQSPRRRKIRMRCEANRTQGPTTTTAGRVPSRK